MDTRGKDDSRQKSRTAASAATAAATFVNYGHDGYGVREEVEQSTRRFTRQASRSDARAIFNAEPRSQGRIRRDAEMSLVILAAVVACVSWTVTQEEVFREP